MLDVSTENLIKTKLIITDTPVNMFTEKNFLSVRNLFRSLISNKKTYKSNLNIIIKKSVKNLIELSADKKSVIISGSTINDLKNPFNIIGILQVVTRFIGIHSAPSGIFLLHGSSSFYKKFAVCFSDDGKSEAKTLSSLECAFSSGNYIGDEFCFLNSKTGKIISYDFIPIHFREIVKKHFKVKHKIDLEKTSFKKSNAGFFIFPSKLFKVSERATLCALIYTHFNEGQAPNIKKLNRKDSQKAIRFSIAAHPLKLLNPELDRMQFMETKDSSVHEELNESLVNKYIKGLHCNKFIKKITQKIPCYKMTINDPCDIDNLLTLIANE